MARSDLTIDAPVNPDIQHLRAVTDAAREVLVGIHRDVQDDWIPISQEDWDAWHKITGDAEAYLKERTKPREVCTANFVKEFDVEDPSTGGTVDLALFLHLQSGGMFAIDASYIEQCFEDDQDPVVSDPLNEGGMVRLLNT